MIIIIFKSSHFPCILSINIAYLLIGTVSLANILYKGRIRSGPLKLGDVLRPLHWGDTVC